MEKFNSVVVWMAGNTVIEGVERRNGEEIDVPAWSFEQVQVFAHACVKFGVQVQVYLANGSYYASYITGDSDDGKLFFRSNLDISRAEVLACS